MRKDIHPKYESIEVTCSCGNKFNVNSTMGNSLTLDICGKCHPFYTGKQKMVDTAGRVEKFKQKYAKKKPAEKQANEE